MAELVWTDDLTVAPAEVFAVFVRPARAVQLSPPGYPLELVAGPEVLTAGATLTLRTRAYGLAQELVHRVEAVEEPARLVFVQQRGPFKAYRLTQQFAAQGDGCRLTEAVVFEPPGGMLGLVATQARLLADLTELYRRRREVFQLRGWLSRP